ncbi:MAG: hypothetical protein JWM88_588 [Verrucomicrobia bacterium]|nr:hypothetical protein [Verrucomicrobiota bacterium]
MAESSDAGLAFKPETMRGAPGFFRVAQAFSGVWWLLDPEDRPFVLRAVNGVRGIPESSNDPVARLRSWGFNALGAASDLALCDDGLPCVLTIGFVESGAAIRTGDARLPDVYDATWPASAARRAAGICGPQSGRRELIGWLADDELGWAQPGPGGRPALLQICLSLEPGFAAYHAAWEFVLALHGGRLDALAKAWAQPITNKEVLREMTRMERGISTRGYLRDDARWTREFAHRYFVETGAAIRAHDPRHLVLGSRFAGRAGAAVLAECQYPAVDVAWLSPGDFSPTQSGPCVLGDFTWVSPGFMAPMGTVRSRGLTTVERMLRRGRAALERMAHHPAVVGYAWSRWQDGLGEQPPFASGLVHANDAEAREHTELLAQVNSRLQPLRAAAAPRPTP